MNKTKFKEHIASLPEAEKLMFLLFVKAVKRNDEPLMEGLVHLASVPKTVSDEVSVHPDFDLLGRLKAVCDEREGFAWGEVLALSRENGHVRRYEALEELARVRTAS